MNNNYKCSGMVLLSTILMTAVLAIVVLSIMETVLLYFKVSKQLVVKHQIFYALESEAYKLQIPTSNCMLKEHDSNEVIKLLQKGRACSVLKNNYRFYYLIEDLGIFPCLQIVSKERIYSSHHFRITIGLFEPSPAVLQIRLSKPAKKEVCPLIDVHAIKMGVISWRYISALKFYVSPDHFQNRQSLVD